MLVQYGRNVRTLACYQHTLSNEFHRMLLRCLETDTSRVAVHKRDNTRTVQRVIVRLVEVSACEIGITRRKIFVDEEL